MPKRKTATIEAATSREFGTFDKNPVRKIVVKPTGSGELDRLIHEGDAIYLLVKAEVQLPKFGRDKGRLTRTHAVKILELAEPDGILINHETLADLFEELKDRRTGDQKLPGLGPKTKVEAEPNGFVAKVEQLDKPAADKPKRSRKTTSSTSGPDAA